MSKMPKVFDILVFLFEKKATRLSLPETHHPCSCWTDESFDFAHSLERGCTISRSQVAFRVNCRWQQRGRLLNGGNLLAAGSSRRAAFGIAQDRLMTAGGWRAERPLPIGHCPGDAGWGRLKKLIRGCGSRKVYCRQDRARKSGGSFPSQTLAGRERLRLTFRRWRRPHHEIAELVRANCTRKQP